MSIKALLPEDVKFIAVHCSASPPSGNASAADIDRWHRLRGFIKIGYHFVIRRDGTVETGRPLNERGAHVEDWNHCSVGVCLVGGVDESKAQKPENNFTQAQFDSLATLLRGLRVQFPNAVIQGHRDFPNVAKACPSFDVRTWAKSVQL
jgi:N-acetylmuramoyl-L-alanine amidase